MAGATPKRAADAFIARFRATVQCVAATEVIGGGHVIGGAHGVTLAPYGRGAGDPAPLRSRAGHRDLLLRVAFQYTIAFVPDADHDQRYWVAPMAYWYGILDGEEREILLFHWHPEGVSDVLTPHLHVPFVSSVALGQMSGKGVGGRSVHLGRMHVPTGYVSLEEIVELLIEEFDVEPRRSDWLDVMTVNRATASRVPRR